MKKFLILAIIFIFALAFAEANISLPSEIIYGKTKAIADSLKKQDNPEYYKVSNDSLLNYKSSFSKKILSNPLLYIYPEYDKVVSLKTGNNVPFYSKILLKNESNYFSLTTKYKNPKKNWQSFYVPFIWKSKKYGKTDFSFFDAQSPWQNYKLNMLSLEYENKLEYKIPYVKKLIYGAGFSQVCQRIDFAKKSRFYFNFDISSNLELPFYEPEIELNIFRQKGQFAAFQKTNLNILPLFDEVQVYTGIAKMHVYPSVAFKLQTINVFNNVFVDVSNKPKFEAINLNKELINKPYTEKSDRFLKKPLNLSLEITNKALPLIKGFYTLQGCYDLPIYYKADKRIYHIAFERALINSAGIDFSFNLKNAKFSNTFSWQSYSINKHKFMPFEPEFTNKTTIKYNVNSNLDFAIDSKILINRKNNLDKKMENACLIDIFSFYKLYRNLSLEASINNVLGVEHVYFDDVPSGGVGFRLGAVYSF